MPIYTYNCRTKQGIKEKGAIDAPSKEQAAKILREKGYIVISIELKDKGERFTLLKAFGGISLKEQVVFTRQLATMLSAGLPLTQALQILGSQTRNAKMREVVKELERDVEGGITFSQGLSKHPEAFSNVYISLIKAGEAAGALDKITSRLALNLEKTKEFQGKTKGALIYPAIVTVAMIAVFIIMTVFVIPKLVTMYEDLGAELPLPTKILIAISEFIKYQWWLTILIVIAFIAGFNWFKKTVFGKYFLARIKYRIPIFGALSKNVEVAELARTLSLLVASGVPILESLAIIKELTRSVLYNEAFKEVIKEVERGVPLSNTLKEQPLFPPILGQMVSVGEETGTMDDALSKVATFFESEAEQTIRNLSTALEPFIMIVLGFFVAILILSIILPIYKLTSQF